MSSVVPIEHSPVLGPTLSPPKDGVGKMIQLDGLRALAVLAVAWSHWAPHKWMLGLPFGTGVQLFFVISGFLITGILLDNRPAELKQPSSIRKVLGRFYMRRCLRIFPVFYGVILICLILNVSDIRGSWAWHAGYLSNFYFFGQGGWGEPISAFRHFWSLAVEEQFYLVWPITVLLLPIKKLRFCILTMIVLAPLSRILFYYLCNENALAKVLPIGCMDALGAGSLLACARRFLWTATWNGAAVARVFLLSGLLLLVGSTVLEILGIKAEALRSLGHTGLVLVYGWVVFRASVGFDSIFGRLLSARLLAYLGKISYGIYLIHHFAPIIFTSSCRLLNLNSISSAPVFVKIACYSVMTLALAASSWRFFEKPLNDLKRFFPYN